ncbi:trp operon leader peptide [Escherichia coli]|nr:trp operon leader peptide [Escherichia coli]TNS52653.1 trp operon leader peptide [Escherichia coli]
MKANFVLKGWWRTS